MYKPTWAPRCHPPIPDRPDPCTHFQTLGGQARLVRLYGTDAAWRLWGYQKLWERDGAGSVWAHEYWRVWDRLPAMLPPPLPVGWLIAA